ncbi:TULIP family P47-like protein [Bacillus sp. SCS-151]|uniref:TULIP family P47-like protein n=1 Tax=Nanhaiella sioensis TaxID=3115293 RepID=UPI00397ACC45
MDTKGWDVINVCSINEINQQLQTNMSKVISSFHFVEDAIEFSGEFNAWQIVSGGSNSLLRFEIPIKSGFLKIGTAEAVDLSGIKPIMEMQLKFIDNVSISNVKNLQFNVEVIGNQPGDTTPGAVTTVTPDKTNKIDASNIAWGILNGLFPKLFLQNKAQLSYIFSSVSFNGLQDSPPPVQPLIVDPPKNLQITMKTDKSVSLKWEPPTNSLNLVGYKVLRDDGIERTVTTPSYEDSDLMSNTSYRYTIKSYAEDGAESEECSIEVTTVSSYSKILKNDYEIELVENNGKLAISFKPKAVASSVDFHYKINDEVQQNVGTLLYDELWIYTISNLAKGSVISYSYTYTVDSSSYDSPVDSYTVKSNLEEIILSRNTINEGDYTIDIFDGNDTVGFIFTPRELSSFVDIHYTVNEDVQQNIKISQKDDNSWNYTIPNVSSGNKITVYYTYTKDDLAYDSPIYTYIINSLDDNQNEENFVSPKDSLEKDNRNEENDITSSNKFKVNELPEELSWLAPKMVKYLYQEPSKGGLGYLSLLSVNTNKNIDDLPEAIDSTLLKENYGVFMLISNELFLKNMIICELPDSFGNGATSSNFVYAPTTGTIGEIQNNGNLSCGTVKWGADTYHPKLTSLSIFVQDNDLLFEASGEFSVTGLANASVTFTISSKNKCRFDPIKKEIYFVKDPNPSISYKKHIPWYDYVLGILAGAVPLMIIDIVIDKVTSKVSESVRNSLYSGNATSFVNDLSVNFITWNGLKDLSVEEAGLSESFYIRGGTGGI